MYKSRDRHRFAASRKALKSSQNGEVIVDNNRSLTPGAIAVNPPANDSRGSYSDEESHQDEDTPVQGAGSGNDYRFANDAFAVVDARPVNEDDVVYAEVQHTSTTQKKWFQRPVLWVSLLAIVLIVVVVVLVVQLKGNSTPALTQAPASSMPMGPTATSVDPTSSPTVAPNVAATPTSSPTVAAPVAVVVTSTPRRP